ncbi:hypothetical protein TWF706_010907 [Orbilia oligospora]|nr:hypothetical protein TWF103_003361 [Orbilia oligospora]KAF3112320.1 hypothetical protein TWF706_010907 [Orbilia oligospora]
MLLDNGAQPDFSDEDGNTPLSRTRNTLIVDLLCKYGPSPGITMPIKYEIESTIERSTKR